MYSLVHKIDTIPHVLNKRYIPFPFAMRVLALPSLAPVSELLKLTEFLLDDIHS